VAPEPVRSHAYALGPGLREVSWVLRVIPIRASGVRGSRKFSIVPVAKTYSTGVLQGPVIHFERFGEVRRIRQAANPTNSKSRTTKPAITKACTSGPAGSPCPLGILSTKVGMSKKLYLPSEALGFHYHIIYPPKVRNTLYWQKSRGRALSIQGRPRSSLLGHPRSDRQKRARAVRPRPMVSGKYLDRFADTADTQVGIVYLPTPGCGMLAIIRVRKIDGHHSACLREEVRLGVL
jgi:hypothetical protein